MKNKRTSQKKSSKKISKLQEIEIMTFEETHKLQGGSVGCGGSDGTLITEPTR